MPGAGFGWPLRAIVEALTIEHVGLGESVAAAGGEQGTVGRRRFLGQFGVGEPIQVVEVNA